MKKILLFILMLILMSWSIDGQPVPVEPVGSGTTADPYQISSLDNLYWISANPSVWDKHFIQTADIDASATSSWNSGAGFSPVGNITTKFTGSYNGDGHKISGLTINRPSDIMQGMFGYTYTSAVIQKIGLENLKVTGQNNTGGLVGYAAFSTISESYVTGQVIGEQFTGGLIGTFFESTVSKSYSKCQVTGSNSVGGLMGLNQWAGISECYASGQVSGSNYYNTKAGGLAGDNLASAIINSYATGQVNGFVYIGGLVGHNQGSSISNSYATGKIGGVSETGGLAGWNNGTVSNCFWDTESSGQSTSAAGTGKTTAEMKTQNTFTGWDFATIWGIREGINYPFLLSTTACNPGTITIMSGSENQTICAGVEITPLVYSIGGGASGAAVSPALPAGLSGLYNEDTKTFTISGTPTVYGLLNFTVETTGSLPCTEATATVSINVFRYSGGDGTEGNPFRIATLTDLQFLGKNICHWDKHFVQTANIDASATSGWGSGGWSPVGNTSAPFVGTYNGMGHTISNLYINRPGVRDQGLFGCTGNLPFSKYARIQNLGVTNVNISGGFNTGGIVGYNWLGYISNCYSTGTVTGNETNVGGLVGVSMTFCSITYCYSEANVTGNNTWTIGGLVGLLNSGSEITNSYSRGSVTSTYAYSNAHIGGLVGEVLNNATIRNCYSTGLVSGPGAGGLIGYKDGAISVISSYWDINTSGAGTSAGGTGKTTALMKTQPTFTGWDFTTTWGINAGKNDGYPYLVTESACIGGTLTLFSGSDTQTVFTNLSITNIVYTVGGGASGVTISPALPAGLVGTYDAVNGTYTISGKSYSELVYNYSLTTTGTGSPCIEATKTGSITVIQQPECAGYAVGLTGAFDSPDSRPETYIQNPELAVGLPDGRPAQLNYPGEFIAIDMTGSSNLYRPSGSSVFLKFNVPWSSYPCNPSLNVQCSMNGTEWSEPTVYNDLTGATYQDKEIVLAANTRYLKLTLTNCDISSGILIDAVTYHPETIPCNCISSPNSPEAANHGPVCEGQEISLSASTVEGATYAWTGPNGFATSEQNPTVSLAATPVMAGTYLVTVTVDGCTSEPASTTVVINTLPEVSITNNKNFCYNTDAEFYLEGTPGAEVTYMFNGETTKTNTAILAEGKATVKVQGAKNDVTLSLISIRNTATGCNKTLNSTSTIIVIPLPAVNISGTNNACVSETLTAVTNASSPTYAWFKDEGMEPVGTDAALTVTQSGNYQLMVTDGTTGCKNTSEPFTVSINPLPEVSITGNNKQICNDENAEFYLEGTPGAVLTYSFDGGTTTRTVTLTGGTAMVVRDEATSDVTLSLISIKLNLTGCIQSLSSTSTVTVYKPFATITGAQSACETATLTAVTDVSGPTYLWGKDDELIPDENSSTLEVKQSGNYRLMVIDGITGCSAISEPFTVTINPLPEVSITGNNKHICNDENAEFYLEGTPGAVLTYSFDGGTTTRTVTLTGGTATVIREEATNDVTLSLISIKLNSPGCTQSLNNTSTVTVYKPFATITGAQSACETATLTAVTDVFGPTYLWGKDDELIPDENSSTLEVKQSGNYRLMVIDGITGCSAISEPFTVTINPLPEVSITRNTIIIGETTSLSPNSGGTWKSNNEAVSTVTNAGIVTGVATGTVTFTFIDATTGCSATTGPVTVTGTPPDFTICAGDQAVNTCDGLCSAVVNYTAIAVGSPEPTVTFEFTGATKFSGTGTGSGATFNKGETYVTITASNSIAPDAVCSFKVTVTDKQDPTIICAEDQTKTADPGKCFATVNVAPPAVSDNCDNNIIPVNNRFEFITNGNFNSGDYHWEDCGKPAEVNTEEYYIVPLPDPSSNFVAEIDNEMSLCQNISGLTIGNKYILTFRATRRQNASTPDPVSANVIIDGGALSKVVTRANQTFDLTPESFIFTATQTSHKLTFTHKENFTTLGLIVDDISIKSITYPVGTTSIVWTATDSQGNTSTCRQNITVTDDELPIIACPEPEASYSTDAGKCTRLLSFDATATDNCGIDDASFKYFIGSKEITFPYLFPLGTTNITVKVSDIHGNSNKCDFEVVVDKITTITSITAVPNQQEYSDKATFTATVEPGLCGSSTMEGTLVLFKAGDQELPPAVPVALIDGEWKATAERYLLENPSSPSNGQMAPGNHTVTALFQNEPEIFIVNDPATALTINCENDITVATDNSETYFTANPTSGRGDVWFRAYIEETDGSAGKIANANINFMNELSSPPVAINLNPASVTPITGEQKAVAVYTLSDYQLNNSEMTTTGGHAWLARAQTGTGSYYCGEDKGEPVVVVLAMPGGDFVTGGGKYLHSQSAGIYAATSGSWMNFGFNMKWNKSGKNLQGNINVVFRSGTKIYHIKSNAINALSVSQVTKGSLTYNTGIMTTKANLTDITDPLQPVNTPYGGNLNLKVVVWDAIGINGGTADKITVELTASDNTTLIYSSFASGINLADAIKGGNINVRNTGGIYVAPTCGAPTNVLAANLTPTSAQITWDAVPTTNTYDIWYKLSSDVNFIQSANDYTTTNIYLLEGLQAGKTYDAKVGRNCINGYYESSVLTFTTTSDVSGCTVSGLIAWTDNTNNVLLSWSPVNTDVTSPPVTYKVEYKKSTANTWTAVNCTVPNLALTLAGSTKYNWRVTPGCSTSSTNGPDFTTGVTKTKSAEIATDIVPEIEYSGLKVSPNPFSERLYFEFASPVDNHVRIQIFDITGRMINTVFDNTVKAGIIYNTEFKPVSLITGMYFYRITIGDAVFVGKVMYKNF